jgi:hypothetical protein
MRILLNAFILGLFFYAVPAFADGDQEHSLGMTDAILHLDLLFIAVWSFVLLLIIITIAIVVHPEKEAGKHLFFWTIVGVSVTITVVFIVQTVIKNVLSETSGPVHWHADFRIIECNEELDILDPEGLLNRVGTPAIHEHNDGRIHIEGTLLAKSEASLGSFFEKVGGKLTSTSFMVPTNYEMAEMKNGDVCKNTNTPGEVQVFLWSVEDNHATQRKLDNFADYIISPHSGVPPGDCLIIEFSETKETTEHLCNQYRVAKKNRKILLDDSLLKP